MVNRTVATFALALGVAIAVVGCEKSDTGTTPSASSPPPSTPATPSGTAAGDAASSTANQATAAANEATGAAQTAAAGATPSADAAAAGAATQPSGAMVAPAEAQKLIDQTVQYVKDNKMDLAEKSLTQLEQMKPKIPVEYHPKIDQARTAFNTAKSGGKLQGLLPGGTTPAAPAAPAAPQ